MKDEASYAVYDTSLHRYTEPPPFSFATDHMGLVVLYSDARLILDTSTDRLFIRVRYSKYT